MLIYKFMICGGFVHHVVIFKRKHTRDGSFFPFFDYLFLQELMTLPPSPLPCFDAPHPTNERRLFVCFVFIQFFPKTSFRWILLAFRLPGAPSNSSHARDGDDDDAGGKQRERRGARRKRWHVRDLRRDEGVHGVGKGRVQPFATAF